MLLWIYLLSLLCLLFICFNDIYVVDIINPWNYLISMYSNDLFSTRLPSILSSRIQKLEQKILLYTNQSLDSNVYDVSNSFIDNFALSQIVINIYSIYESNQEFNQKKSSRRCQYISKGLFDGFIELIPLHIRCIHIHDELEILPLNKSNSNQMHLQYINVTSSILQVYEKHMTESIDSSILDTNIHLFFHEPECLFDECYTSVISQQEEIDIPIDIPSLDYVPMTTVYINQTTHKSTIIYIIDNISKLDFTNISLNNYSVVANVMEAYKFLRSVFQLDDVTYEEMKDGQIITKKEKFDYKKVYWNVYLYEALKILQESSDNIQDIQAIIVILDEILDELEGICFPQSIENLYNLSWKIYIQSMNIPRNKRITPSYSKEQLFAIFAPFWIPIFVPIVKGLSLLRNKNKLIIN